MNFSPISRCREQFNDLGKFNFVPTIPLKWPVTMGAIATETVLLSLHFAKSQLAKKICTTLYLGQSSENCLKFTSLLWCQQLSVKFSKTSNKFSLTFKTFAQTSKQFSQTFTFKTFSFPNFHKMFPHFQAIFPNFQAIFLNFQKFSQTFKTFPKLSRQVPKT